VLKSERKRDRDLNSLRVLLSPQQQEAFGGVVTNEQELVVEQQGFEQHSFEQQGFTTEDILWAVGIWSVILCLSPVIVFYMLMVA
jgi:hypothetical protein